MALQIPGYSVPTPYAQNPDIIGQFGKGYDFSRGIINENEAKAALGEYVKSLYAGGAPQGAPAPAASVNPIDALIGADHSAASGASDPTLTAYFDKLGQSESGGDPNAKNPNSSAGGLYQITDPTWQALVAQNPNSGLTLDGKMDPQQQQIGVRLLTQQNAGALKSAGQPVNPATLYAAHFLGAPTATSVLGYADNTPMTAAVPPEVLQANPQLQNMTVGDFKSWAGQQGGNGQGGYRPPMMQPQGGPGGLPPEAVLADLFANPNTREFAAGITKTRTDPQAAATLASTEAEVALKNAQANAYSQFGGKIPPGYMPGPNGGLVAIPNGPADPSNPLNYNKVNPFGQPTGADGSGGAATADSVPVQLGADGKPDPQQQADYIKTLPPTLQPLVAGVVNYTLDPNKVVGIKGNARAQLIAAAKAADPSFDMAQYPARATMIKSATSGPIFQTITQAQTTINHLAELDSKIASLGNGDFVPLNAFENWVKTNTGNPAQTVFAQTAQAAADEMAKFFKGVGATDVQSIKDWQSTLNGASSPAQLHGAIQNAVANLMQAKLNTIQAQYKSTMGGRVLPGFMTPETLASLQKMGVDPQTLDPDFNATGAATVGGGSPPPPATAGNDASAPTVTAVDANGNRIGLVNGAWVPMK